MKKILMIEDDLELAEILTEYLEQFDFQVVTEDDPFKAVSILKLEPFDLVILDLTLPGMDGLEVCQKIVQKSDIPIIISSARSDISDKIMGLQIGADDYLPKPYDPKEMYARIISLLRRYNKINKEEKEALDYLIINKEKKLIFFKSTQLFLTPAEYIVLSLLIKNKGNSVSKEQIIYDSDIFQNSSENSINVIISRLRKKLDKNIQIKSTRGIGYRLI